MKHVKMSIYLIFRGHFVCKHGDAGKGTVVKLLVTSTHIVSF